MQDFFFRTTKLGYYLLMVPKEFRYVLSAIFLACISVVWLLCVYKPLQKISNQRLVIINTLHDAQNAEEKIIEENSILETLVHKKQKIVSNHAQKYKTNYKSSNALIMIIVDLATKSNVTISSHIPQDSIEHDWYTTHSFKTAFQGTFSAIINFLDGLKKQPMIHLITVHVSKSDGIVSLVCDFNLIEIKEDSHESTSIS